MNARTEKNKTRTMVLRMLAGAIVGAAGAALFLQIVGERHMKLADPAAVLAMVAGLVYALMGLFVGLGLAIPNAGAELLNVEDEQELREERPKLRTAAIASMLIGLFLLTLAASGDSGSLLSSNTALVIAGTCFFAIIAMNLWLKGTYDELTLQISVEASALAMHFALVLLGGWAALAHLGFAPWLGPLGMIALLALLELAAIFWVGARKGLLTPA